MTASHDDLVRKNKRVGLIFLGIVFGMVALSFASVPLYRLFCQMTGFGGTPKINPDAVAEKVLDREVTVRFNADLAQNMPWTFRADNPAVSLKIGQKGLATFYARNPTGQPVTGTAIFNVLPEAAAQYFQKTQCFCFDRQTLNPGQDTHMPVVFFIDPKIAEDPDMKDIKTITLSYTFFQADSQALEDALQDLYNSGN